LSQEDYFYRTWDTSLVLALAEHGGEAVAMVVDGVVVQEQNHRYSPFAFC
jgi:hypothetical protein